MTYQIDVIKLAEYVLSLPNGRAVQLYAKKNPQEVDQIINNTTFLLETNKLSSRCYCITHNIYTKPTCKMCNNNVDWIGNAFRTYCSRKCKGSDEDIKDKVRYTTQQRFGVDNASQAPVIKQKKIDTCLANHGVMYPQQSEQILQKSCDAIMLKYGVKRPLQNKEIQEKMEQTNMERYGHRNIAQGTKKEQVKQTMLDRYEVEYPLQNKIIQRKIRHTRVKKYGKFNKTKPHIVNISQLLESKDWMVDQYLTQNKTSAIIASELGICGSWILVNIHKHDIKIRRHWQRSMMCNAWLTSISIQNSIDIEHEFKIPETLYHADGYCRDTNTIYEFHGDYWHGNPDVYASDAWNKKLDNFMGNLYQATIIRENKIKELGYNLVTIWENDYNKMLTSLKSDV
jgi:hypothetical protein